MMVCFVFFPACYPNETIIVTNPNSGTYTHVVAVEDEGTSSATDCSVSVSGGIVEITSCDLVSYFRICKYLS